MHDFLANKLPEVTSLLKQYQVKKAYAFGSVCTDRFTEKSDIDLLISFEDGLDPLVQGENWWSLYYGLQKLTGREIDLVTDHSLKNPYFVKVVNLTKATIYE
jgi:predicted nucleotidyltransferase